jgi:hypothetical protein
MKPGEPAGEACTQSSVCGLAHQGFFKREGETVTMLANGANCGIVQNPNTGGYKFVVERYYEHLKPPPRSSRRRSSHRQDPDSHRSSRNSSRE